MLRVLEAEIQSGASIQSLNSGRSVKHYRTLVLGRSANMACQYPSRAPEIVLEFLFACYNFVQNTPKNKNFTRIEELSSNIFPALFLLLVLFCTKFQRFYFKLDDNWYTQRSLVHLLSILIRHKYMLL